MATSRLVPEDPAAFLRRCVAEGRVFWSYHARVRLKQRTVTQEMILESAGQYEIIESNPDDKYLPSYLVLSRHTGIQFHVLFAADIAGGNIRVVTAYLPDKTQWEDDLRTRRTP